MRAATIARFERACVIALTALLAVASCGGDDGAAPGGPPPTAPTAAKPAKKAAPKVPPKQLVPQQRVENRVACPLPQKGSKKCDLKAPKAAVVGLATDQKADPVPLVCGEGEYCLQTSDEGYLCGRCPERDQIRHVFKERDFAVEQNRDPFQSFVVKTIGPVSTDPALQKDLTSRCPRADQLVATNFGFQDLKLVGISAQGTQRKVLMMDPAFGHIIKRGDCVGKEKAWVKEIGDNFVCFEIAPDATSGRPVEGICIEMHSKTVATTPPSDDGTRTTANPPVVAPPPPAGPTTTTTTTVTQPRVEPPPPPPQAPTNLKP